MVVSQSGQDVRLAFEANDCSVVCQFCPESAPLRRFPDAMVAANLDEQTFASFMAARMQVAERRVCQQQEANFQWRLAEVREQLSVALAQEQTVHRHRLHIAEELLTLKCPRCARAFVDFEGCFALKCTGCGCGFCAWCLADCGSDAHGHVATCKQSARRAGHHGSFQEFNAAQGARRRAAVMQYLQTLEADVHADVVAACAQDFADLGLDIQVP
eukprot:CAMPEP_0179102716 /NCGR_PEP_ID=MMETSP0796-20121207/47555_1 /TAXON_ID=73915 /ORGANISM="Pyrodinium bahamense, Strain pbaha01" /LENGTH=214 /DNA_ID=CAMNT_0020800599 /DNA_START=53 /DNA_END=697 /DNA_ORIENTATION=-